MGTLTVIFIVKKQKYLLVLGIIFLLLGIFTTGYAMTRSDFGKEEFPFVQKALNPSLHLDMEEYLDQKAVAALMDNTKGLILLDTDQGFAIPLFAKNSGKYVITQDTDYINIVKKYYKFVNWIVIDKPSTQNGNVNIIYKYYPNMYNGKAPHIHFYKQLYSWKIFRVDK